MPVYIRRWTLATVQVIYHIPDHIHILNEFSWQTKDRLPEYPRIHEFLDYWDKHIAGPIKEAYIYDHDESKIRHVDRKYKFN